MTGPEQRVEGVLVRVQPVADAALIITLLSADAGRVEAYARNARASTRRFGGRLELFGQGSARIGRARGSLPLLAGFDRGPSLVGVDLDYTRLLLCSHAAELALASSQPDHADPDLHAWLCRVLRSLGTSRGVADPAAARIGLELGWLQAIGAAPPIDSCSGCGAPWQTGALWPRSHDGLRCLRCEGREGADISLDDLDLLAALVRDPAAAGGRPTPRGARLLRQRVAGLLDEQLGRRTRSASALDGLETDPAADA